MDRLLVPGVGLEGGEGLEVRGQREHHLGADSGHHQLAHHQPEVLRGPRAARAAVVCRAGKAPSEPPPEAERPVALRREERTSSEPIRNPLMDRLLTPQNAALLVIDYQPTQVRDRERTGARLTTIPSMLCELQRDWARKETVPAFFELLFETPADLELSDPARPEPLRPVRPVVLRGSSRRRLPVVGDLVVLDLPAARRPLADDEARVR